MINYDDFKKVEMTIGEIKTAEKVEGSEKLYKLSVYFGGEGETDDTRQIISGIQQSFSIEELIGKRCAFVTNLEPRKIMGLDSNGMILAVKNEEEGKLKLFEVDNSIKPGTKAS